MFPRLSAPLLAALIALLLAASAWADPVTDGLRAAKGLAREGQPAEAWKVVSSLSPLQEEDVPALRELATALEALEAYPESLDVLARALRASPTDEGARHDAEAQLQRHGPPLWLSKQTVQFLPIAVHVLASSPDGPESLSWIDCAPYVSQAVYAEPRTGKTMAWSRCLYSQESERWQLRFAVHCETSEDSPLAEKTGLLLARLRGLARQRLGVDRPLLGDGDLQVWLCPWGAAGGEHWRNNLFFYDVRKARAPAEWVREIAHEFGHAMLPSPGGYREPESWSNGPLGERLFLRWLSEAAAPPRPAPPVWSPAPDFAAYQTQKLKPLRERFLMQAPAKQQLAVDQAQAMDSFLALALTVEETYGPRLLSEALAGMAGSAPADFWVSLAAKLATPEKLSVRAEGGFPVLSSRHEAIRLLQGGGPEEPAKRGYRVTGLPGGKGQSRLAAEGEWVELGPGWNWVDVLTPPVGATMVSIERRRSRVP
ncbi:MAG TPA: hypothetical protein VGN26_13775 [Armatimonadota bacterium]|jgi:hypothetical protein